MQTKAVKQCVLSVFFAFTFPINNFLKMIKLVWMPYTLSSRASCCRLLPRHYWIVQFVRRNFVKFITLNCSFYFLTENNQIRSPSTWSFHGFPGFLGPNIPSHPPPEAQVNLSTLSALQANPLQAPRPQVNLQNTSAVPMLPHYTEPRFQGITQYPFRTSPQATTNTTLTTVSDGIGAGINQVGAHSSPSMEPSHGMYPTACQQLNSAPGTNSMNGAMFNNNTLSNGLVNNGYTFRPQPFMHETSMSKGNMPIPQTTSGGPITQVNGTTTGVSFPLPRPGGMPMVGQNMGSPQRIPIPLGNVDLNSGYNTLPRSDGHGMITLKQEPIDTISNHVVNHHNGLEVSHADTVLHERNGTSTPKGVWRPY